MAYMIYQQLTDAVRSAYRGTPEAAGHAAEASRYRAWLESLDLEPRLRAPLLEQAAALEAAFRWAASNRPG